jgi:hypothetical protein
MKHFRLPIANCQLRFRLNGVEATMQDKPSQRIVSLDSGLEPGINWQSAINNWQCSNDS